jgi:Domain of unknown function (DUF4337)
LEAREAIERAHEAEAAGGHGAWPEKAGVVLVAVLAALLAVASVFGRRSVADLLLYQSQAADATNVAEANAIKERVDETALINLRVFATDPDTRQAAEGAIAELEQRIARTYRPAEERLTQRAEELDQSRDDAERRYESFEWAETVLQMAIVFTTIGIAARSMRLIWAAIAVGVLGLFLTIDGFLTVLPL